jgi:hypothetical protein
MSHAVAIVLVLVAFILPTAIFARKNWPKTNPAVGPSIEGSPDDDLGP